MPDPRKRKAMLQTRRTLVEQEITRLGGRLEKQKALAGEAKGDEAKEKHSDQIEELAAKRQTLRSELEHLAADLGNVNAKLRRRARKAKRAAQRRLASRRYWASEHFRYAEFDCREGPGVPAYMHDDLADLCRRILEPLRSKFGAAHVNSGHRWEFYNRKIGGATSSYHEYEKRRDSPAADMTFARGNPREWADEARRLGAGGVGTYSSFVHVDTGPRRDWSG